MCVGVPVSQKRMSNSLEHCELSDWALGTDLCPLDEQQTLLPAEPFL